MCWAEELPFCVSDESVCGAVESGPLRCCTDDAITKPNIAIANNLDAIIYILSPTTH